MPIKCPIIKTVSQIRVSGFYETYRRQLELQLMNSPQGMTRYIRQQALNRPGLALAGYFGYFAHERIQVFGAGEMAYLSTLQGEERRERLERIFRDDIPCIIFAHGDEVPADVIEIADRYSVCVFRTQLTTTKFVNRTTVILETEFADSTSLHGCMVNVRGMGVLLMGESGIGKSEISLGLVEHGAALIADDLVRVRNLSGELIASAPKLSSGFIEIRGLGIINVTNLFGLRAYSRESRIDLIINLCLGKMTEMERLGLERKTMNILGVDVDRIDLPVSPGRDMTRLVEIAAMSHYLRQSGYDMASEFNMRLHEKLAEQAEQTPDTPTP